MQLTLLTRAYCGLCDVMRDAVAPLATRHGVPLVEFDVDTEPALERAWGDLVPVLLAGTTADGRELCHHHFDATRVAGWLDALARTSKIR